MSKKLLGTLLSLAMVVGAPGSVFAATVVSGDLDMDGLTTSKIDINRGGSTIYDNGNLHIATDDNLEIDASGTTYFSGGIQVTGATSLKGNMTLGDAATDSITATGYFTQMRVGTGTVFGNIGTVGPDELGVEGAVEIDGAAWLDGAL
ncbi:MAG: hypothetical protein Q8N84_01785, partial [bacterium]|nr:hypothetical protein [bacterium]